MIITISNLEFRHSERKTGEFTPEGESEKRSYDFTVCRFLHDESDRIVEVRLPKGVHVHNYERGKKYAVPVEVPDRTKLTLLATAA